MPSETSDVVSRTRLRLPSERTEAFGPYRVYHLARGLTLNCGADTAYLRGGPRLYIAKDLPTGPHPGYSAEREIYAQLADWVEATSRSVVMASATKGLDLPSATSPAAGDPTGVLPPTDCLFRVVDGLMHAAGLAGELLGIYQSLEFWCRVLLSGRSDGGFDFGAQNAAATVAHLVRDGRLGPAAVDAAIAECARLGMPIESAFFLLNLSVISEDAQTTMLRACHHATSLTAAIWSVNQQDFGSEIAQLATSGPREIAHFVPSRRQGGERVHQRGRRLLLGPGHALRTVRVRGPGADRESAVPKSARASSSVLAYRRSGCMNCNMCSTSPAMWRRMVLRFGTRTSSGSMSDTVTPRSYCTGG
jgi:hypothetical protein